MTTSTIETDLNHPKQLFPAMIAVKNQLVWMQYATIYRIVQEWGYAIWGKNKPEWGFENAGPWTMSAMCQVFEKTDEQQI
jgi:hypothetical protein